jgi:hypothetical protein
VELSADCRAALLGLLLLNLVAVILLGWYLSDEVQREPGGNRLAVSHFHRDGAGPEE